MNNMIIHSFFTDGLYDWAVLFLESFKYHHGDEEYKIVFKTLGVDNDGVIRLHDIYSNLDVIQRNYNWKKMSDMLNVSVGKLKRMKDEIEHGSDKVEDFYKWKIMMSVEERYRKAIPEAIELYKHDFRYLFHLDIDMYFNKNIAPIEKKIKGSDIALELRTTGVKSTVDKTKIAGGILGFDMHSPSTRRLIRSWCKFIDAVSPENKPREYGQTSLYYAYNHMNGKTKWGVFKFGKEMTMFEDSKSIIWSGNRGNADKKLNVFRREFGKVRGNLTKVEEKVLDKKIEDAGKTEYDVIIHSFLTEGMFEWARLFLRSLKKYNKEKWPVVLSTRDLEELQIKELEDIYSNIEVHNRKNKMNKICRDIGAVKRKLLRWKEEVENGESNNENFKWKVYMSVEERYKKSIKEVMSRYKCNNILHFDIDTCFRGDIQPLVDLTKRNDVSLRFRDNDMNVKGKICGNLIGLTMNDKTEEFMRTWINRINKKGIKKMPKGFGQISLYKTYKDLEKNIKWGRINDNVVVDRHFNKKALIWEGNRGPESSKEYKMERYIQETL